MNAYNDTPLFKAVKAKCLDCSCGHKQEVINCPIKSCPLYVYRLGITTLIDDKKKQSRRFRNDEL
jgi:hypothetical protein